MNSVSKGRVCEKLAADFLEKLGYHILAMNYKGGYCEIDIIAQRDEMLVFVEVKARSNTKYGLPREAVGKRKQLNLIAAAERYLYDNQLDTRCSFDVIEVYTAQNYSILHIQNAFEC